jgi:hypothetical protein
MRAILTMGQLNPQHSKKVEELTGRTGCPGLTRYNEKGREMEASKILVATAVGLASEATFVTGNKTHPMRRMV